MLWLELEWMYFSKQSFFSDDWMENLWKFYAPRISKRWRVVIFSRSGNGVNDQRLKYKIPIWPDAISLGPEILLSSAMGWEMANEEYQAQCFESDCLKVKPELTFWKPVVTRFNDPVLNWEPEFRQCSAVAQVLSAWRINSLCWNTGQAYDNPRLRVVPSPLFKTSCVHWLSESQCRSDFQAIDI